MVKLIDIDNGVLKQETTIGRIEIDLTGRRSVSYTTIDHGGAHSALRRGIIFPCKVLGDAGSGVVRRGWTFLSHVSDGSILKDVDSVLIDQLKYVIWDEYGELLLGN